MTTKTGRECGITGPLDAFDKRGSWCLSCRKTYRRAHYDEHKRKIEAISNGAEDFVSVKCRRCGKDTCPDDVKSYPLCRDCFKADISRKSKLRRQRRKKIDRKSTRLNSSHLGISYAVFCLK